MAAKDDEWGKTSEADDSPLLTKYQPFDLEAIDQEMRILENIREEVAREWQIELDQYMQEQIKELEGEDGDMTPSDEEIDLVEPSYEGDRLGRGALGSNSEPGPTLASNSGKATKVSTRLSLESLFGKGDTSPFFPYHRALYPLLGDLLGEDGRLVLMGGDVEDFCPCSLRSIRTSLVPRNRCKRSWEEEIPFRWEFTRIRDRTPCGLLDEWQHDLVDPLVLSSVERPCFHSEVVDFSEAFSVVREDDKIDQFGPAFLPKDEEECFSILMKVLRHALNDFQRDHRLARAVLLLIGEMGIFHDSDPKNESKRVHYLRRLLCVSSFNYVNRCDGSSCDDTIYDEHGVWIPPQHRDANPDATTDHVCGEWVEYIATLSNIICSDMTYVSSSYASTLSAYVAMECCRQVNDYHMHFTDEGWDPREIEPCEFVKRSELVEELIEKQRYLFELSDFLEDKHDAWEKDPFGSLFITKIISFLGEHAKKDRNRLKRIEKEVFAQKVSILSSDSQSKAESLAYDITFCLWDMRQTTDSFYNCVRMLTNIGESLLKYHPPSDKEGIVAEKLIDSIVDAFEGRQLGDGSTGLAKFERYADSVTNASKVLYLYDQRRVKEECRPQFADASAHDIDQLFIIAKEMSTSLKKALPSDDAIDVVKALFFLAHVTSNEYGYGDFLVRFGLPISLTDPFIYHFLMTAHEEDDKIALACHDFSLVLLRRAWQKPWTPQSNLSFSHSFRQTIWTMSLCAHRLGMPSDVAQLVNSFLPRDWFSDEREVCWCQDCMMRDMVQKLYRPQFRFMDAEKDNAKANISVVQPAPKELQTCSGCRLVKYRSKECRNILDEHFHEQCGKPPFRIPGVQEKILCREALKRWHGQSYEIESDDTIGGESNQGDDDDASSDWESINSHDEENGEDDSSFTHFVLKWFTKRSYGSWSQDDEEDDEDEDMLDE
uniref:Uncharacterized protein n=1 Tax=Attheya septentrionalis TaxID=420275 RepID=A0A7S2XM59_9STRA|mmetsp:Transcript_13105/g.23750  ORF Transcript_13105/g.23750 Transcript_13105/m.23750 type:complete len:941 (+) Transcript_13105:355-3177(+)